MNAPAPAPAPERYVVLLEEEVQDPRATEGDRQEVREVRVVLRLDAPNKVMIEIEDGRDALDAIAWERLDQPKGETDAKNLLNLRAAYQLLCRVAANLYHRARASEENAARETARARQFEARLLHAKTARPIPATTPPPKPTLPPNVQKLLALATDEGTTPGERRAAANAAQEALRRAGLFTDPSPVLPFPPPKA